VTDVARPYHLGDRTIVSRSSTFALERAGTVNIQYGRGLAAASEYAEEVFTDTGRAIDARPSRSPIAQRPAFTRPNKTDVSARPRHPSATRASASAWCPIP